jgi:hypothetical protein
MTFEKDQGMCAMLYMGPSKVESDAVYNYLEENRKNATPIEMQGSGRYILITDASVVTNSDGMGGTMYRVILKGVYQ